jgi:hypothetical protein
MREYPGDLWDFHAAGCWIGITTNGVVKNDGTNVMGRGTAQQAARKFPALPASLGGRITGAGNHVHVFGHWRLFTYPVKTHWRDRADLALIRQSAEEVMDWLHDPGILKLPRLLFLPRPGCGHGQRTWEEVKPVIAPILSDRIVVLERP